MQKGFLLLLLSFFASILFAQDAYHSQLINRFEETNLPIGEWVFFDNETAILNIASGYGGTFITQESDNTDFSTVVNANISRQGINQWDSGWNLRNPATIIAGDRILLIFSIRSLGGTGQVNIFVEDASTFAKETFLTVDIAEEWTQYVIPFEASKTYTANTLSWGFHLAHQIQNIEIGGYTAMNFRKSVALTDLPNEINNDQYDGAAADAPWRASAAERIDQFRKSNLSIQVMDTEGQAVSGSAIQVKMLRHEFAFGTAIKANLIAGNNAQNNLYERRLTNLDGNGRGFNWVVFENSLKWPAWEEHWIASQPEIANATQWLRARGIEIRGHALVWPGADNLPADINENSNNTAYIKNRVIGHLTNILNYPNIKGEIAEWDVLNEIATNRSLENYFRGKEGYVTGREYLAEIFHQTRNIDPNTGLWLNDFVTLSTNSNPGDINYDNLKLFTRELLDAGVDLEGLGFQGHIGGFPNGIPSVLEVLDDFHNEFGLKAKITEFDLPSFVAEETAGQYLGDFLTAIFSHESMNGFLFWSFWDGATYMNEGSNLFRIDWSQTPAGDAFMDLVFNEWWTDESLTTSSEGLIDTRVFKGLYEIVYEVNGELIRDTINITEDTNFEITANNISTKINDLVSVSYTHLTLPTKRIV